MKKVLLIGGILFISIANMFAQGPKPDQPEESNAPSSENYKTTTIVLIDLMESAARKGAHGEVFVCYSALLLLKEEYDMRPDYIDRIETFKENNIGLSLPYDVDFNGVSSETCRNIIHSEKDPLVRGFYVPDANTNSNANAAPSPTVPTKDPNTTSNDFKSEGKKELKAKKKSGRAKTKKTKKDN